VALLGLQIESDPGEMELQLWKGAPDLAFNHAHAQRADVARATVYYQFRSKTGLLEALCDALAERGGMAELSRAFSASDPDDALRLLVSAFARFWGTDRLVMRRLRALAALDPDVAGVITARDERRRQALKTLLDRRDDVVDLPHALRIAHG
jgi:AcrR family transcriptional regulator